VTVKFTLDARSDVNLIRGYGAAGVRVGDRSVPMPCILSADTLITDWDAPHAEALAAEHLTRVWALEPEVILLGTGSRQRFAPARVREACAARGIGLESMDLGAACRTYNILVQEERRVVALLFG
jgi:uncharacterized protein